MDLDRRRFLQVAAVGVVAAIANPACARGEDRAVDRPQLVDMLGPDRVRKLGERYRAQTPSEGSAEALRASIAKARGLFGTSIDDMIEDDFESDRTVLVDGWMLSVTEARQVALFSLTTA